MNYEKETKFVLTKNKDDSGLIFETKTIDNKSNNDCLFLGEFKVLETSKSHIVPEFKIYNYEGTEIFKVKEVYKSLYQEEVIANIKQVLKAREFGDFTYVEKISKKEDLEEGDEIIVFRLIGFDFAKVKKVMDSFVAETNYSLFPLEFGKDDRKCWICTGEINKKCLDVIKSE